MTVEATPLKGPASSRRITHLVESARPVSTPPDPARGRVSDNGTMRGFGGLGDLSTTPDCSPASSSRCTSIVTSEIISYLRSGPHAAHRFCRHGARSSRPIV